MGILTKLANIFSGRGGNSRYGALRARQASDRFNWPAEVGELRLNPIVAICLDWSCRNINTVPIRLYRKTRSGDEIQLTSHPVLDILKTPNPLYSGSDLLSALFTDIMLIGNAFVLKARTNAGQPGELYWLDGRYTAPDFPLDGSAYLHSWSYTPAGTGKTAQYDPADIIDFRRGIDPLNDRLGISPIRSVERSVAVVNLLEKYTGSVLKNSGSTNIVISPVGEGIFLEEEAAKLRMSIQQRISGEMAGTPLVFTAPTDVKSLGSTPRDLMLTDMDQHAVARICAAFGQSPMIHGLPDSGKTYANYKEAVRASWENGLCPHFDLISDTINHKLLPEFDPSGRLRVGFDMSLVEAMAEDQETQAKRSSLLFEKNIITLNEAREMIGKEPTPLGDVFNFELAAELAEQDTGPDDGGEDDGETADDGEEAENYGG